MENNNQKQQKEHGSDTNIKESTNSGGNDDTSSTSSSKPKDIIHEDVCAICFDDVSILDTKTYMLYICCGKVLHKKCAEQLRDTKSLSAETRKSCIMCRAPNVAQGSKESIKRLQRWSQRGKSWAQCTLGAMYKQGLGVNRDPKRAFELIKLAADQGHHVAQYNLGNMYADGRGVIQSDTLAFKYWKLSAIQGTAAAQYNVAVAYEKGKGVEQSDTETFKYYRLAADQGDHPAQFSLGVMYAQGKGVIQSDILACELFKLSAEGGVGKAQCNLGSHYARGSGVAQSNKNAREWYTKAAKQGDKIAINNLKLMDEQEGRTSSTVCQFEGCESTTKKNGKELMRCPCQTASYCCKEHQKLAYPGHKKECKRLRKEMLKQKPNDRCNCGSKKKYKKCCGSKKR